jgi:electron transfer flavoprotein beta subunit
MRILTCVKYVPDPVDEVSFTPGHTLDRAASSSLLSELDEYAVEQALRVSDALPDASVAALTVGPSDAEAALRKALQMGAAEAYLVCDDAVVGSDVFGTVAVLAAAVRTVPDVGLVVCGMTSTDGETGVVPALLAAALGWPLLSMAASVEVAGSVLRATRVDEAGARTVEAPMPAVLSVTDQTGEPRYPTFKDVMAAKKKPVTEWSLADLGVDPATVGADAARVEIAAVTRNPERQAGRVVVDEGGSSVTEIVAFLAQA